mmetsp:Transcript_86537/g.222911  ORF Transcript_86537/g.222911 Transcript_86537/m.222911 type:complete len:231 (+) Transcript_86537:1476-2168(+)
MAASVSLYSRSNSAARLRLELASPHCRLSSRACSASKLSAQGVTTLLLFRLASVALYRRSNSAAVLLASRSRLVGKVSLCSRSRRCCSSWAPASRASTAGLLEALGPVPLNDTGGSRGVSSLPSFSQSLPMAPMKSSAALPSSSSLERGFSAEASSQDLKSRNSVQSGELVTSLLHSSPLSRSRVRHKMTWYSDWYTMPTPRSVTTMLRWLRGCDLRPVISTTICCTNRI